MRRLKHNRTRQRRRGLTALFVFACTLLLCACRAVDSSASAAGGISGTDDSSQFGEAAYGASEADGPWSKLDALENIRASVTADFDGDGVEEAFALIGREVDGEVEGELLFLTQAEEEHFPVLDAEGGNTVTYFMKDARRIDAGSRCFALFESSFAAEKGTVLVGVRDGKPYQVPVYGAGFRQDGEDYIVWQSALDAEIVDGIPVGRTEKPYALYWDEADGRFCEYGAVEIDRAVLEGISGGTEILSELDREIAAGNGELGSILRRGNGTIDINYRLNVDEADENGENRYLELALEDGTLVLWASGEGIYLPALLPEIVVYPEESGF